MRTAVCALVLVLQASSADLRVIDAVISDRHNGAAVPADRHFNPGERVFLQFKIADYHRAQESNQIFLEYSVEAVDAKGIAVEPRFEQRLLTKTFRNETRPLAYDVQVPPAPLNGEAKFRISVRDRLADQSITTEIPFKVRSGLEDPGSTLTIQAFRYFSSEFSDTPMSEPVFRPGDRVWGRFYLTGFDWAGSYRYALSYGVTLRNKAGKVLFTEMQAVSESRESFYPKWHVPGMISVRLEYEIRPGEYTITIDARDENGNKTTKAEFPVTVR